MMRWAMAMLSICALVTGIHTHIPSGDPECFLLDAQKFKEGISLNYDVISGIGEELETTLLSPSGIRLYHQVGPKGRFVTPVPEDGVFQACFAHQSSVPLVVGFSFHADDPAHDVLSNADATKIGTVSLFKFFLTLYTLEHARAVEDMVFV
uniref:Secreted protein n=1 Tax=Thraustotheca clavata TaxID=74557 RepID=A0A0A7CMN9_9STRA|nr:secreted protein [Thraustotheca clavata]